MDSNHVLLGYLNANIAGDARYTDTIQVFHSYVDTSVVIVVKSTTASGGMDGNGGTTDMGIKLTVKLPDGVKAGEVLKEIKKILADTQWNFKAYGKPTKNFWWRGNLKGVSAKIVSDVLENWRSE